MTRNLMLIGIIMTVLIFFAYIKDKNLKDIKYIILIGPFILGGIIYGSVLFLTRDIPSDACDGGALMGILLSFIFIGMGILINLANIIHLLIKNTKDMQYKRQIFLAIIFTSFIVLFFRNNTKINRKISKDLEIKVPISLDFQYLDTHGGFHGDGIMFAKASLNDKNIERMIGKSKQKWTKTPMSENIELELYGGKRGEIYRESNLAKDMGMAKIKEGYWIFLDRSKGNRTFTNGENLFPRISANYSLGIIDIIENKFYYIKFDS